MAKPALENMLRPPVEFIPASTAVVAALLLLARPGWFAIGYALSAPMALALVLYATWRIRQGRSLLQYRAGLDEVQPYRIQPGKLPFPEKQIFIGRGFHWTGRHTQRWSDLQHEMARGEIKNLAAGDSPSLLTTVRREGWIPALAGLIVPPRHTSTAPTAAQELGGSPGMHAIEPDERDVCLNLAERPGHVLVLGTTRVGKSRLLEVLVTQDIHRGDVVIVLDPKGDIGVLQRMYAEAARAGREQDFYFFHLGYPELSSRYNPVGDFARLTEVADRIAGGVAGGSGDSDVFRQFVWHFVQGTVRGMVAMEERPTYKRIRHYLLHDLDGLAHRYLEWALDRNPQTPGWRGEIKEGGRGGKPAGADKELRERNERLSSLVAYFKRKQIHDDVAASLIELVSHPRQHFEKLVASVKPMLEKVTSGKVGDLLSPDYADLNDPRPIFDWSSIISNGGIVYVGLDALSSSTVAGAVGSAMFADLTSVASRIYKRGIDHGQSSGLAKRKLSIHADEFNELIGDEFIPMINKAGGAGFQVVAYTQTAADIEAKVGSAPKARQIEGNFNTRIYMRVIDEISAKSFTDRLGEANVASMTAVSRAADANDPESFAEFTSNNEDRLTIEKAAMLLPSDLGKLPKGHAFALLNGGQLWKVRIPMMDTEGDPCFVGSVEEIAGRIAERYGIVLDGGPGHLMPLGKPSGRSAGAGLTTPTPAEAPARPGASVAGARNLPAPQNAGPLPVGALRTPQAEHAYSKPR